MKNNNLEIRNASLWPEDRIPENAKGCRKCELCEHAPRIIWGEGNPQGAVIVILDNPGLREDRDDKEFVCGTRQTIQQAAATSGFTPDDLYVTYILKCRPMRKYNKEQARLLCMGYLDQQLEANRYKAAFCLGDTAVKSFFNNKDMTVKFAREIWHEVRGIPVYVSYHPLAVRRRPNLYSLFVKDWLSVKLFIDNHFSVL